VIIKFRNWYAQGRFTSGAKYPNEILDSCAQHHMAFIGLNRALLQPDTIPWTIGPIQFNSSIYFGAAGYGTGIPYGNPLIVIDPESLKVHGEYSIIPHWDIIYKFKGRKIK
jgi:hypothetical protein